MAELVWSETVREVPNIRAQVVREGGSQQTARNKTSIWAGPEKVSLVYSVLRVGNPKGHPDKFYWKWWTHRSMGFRRNANGTIIPYHSDRDIQPSKKAQWINHLPNDVFRFLTEDSECSLVFRDFVRKYMGIREMADLYPAAAQQGIYKYNGMPGAIRGAYRQPTIEQFAGKVFGTSRVTKELLKSFEGNHPMLISLGSEMRGLTDTDNIIRFLNINKGSDQIDNLANVSLRPLFRNIDPKSFTYLTSELFTANMEPLLRGLAWVCQSHNRQTWATYKKGEVITEWKRL